MSDNQIWDEKSLTDALQASAALTLLAAAIARVVDSLDPSPAHVEALFREAEELSRRGIFAATWAHGPVIASV